MKHKRVIFNCLKDLTTYHTRIKLSVYYVNLITPKNLNIFTLAGSLGISDTQPGIVTRAVMEMQPLLHTQLQQQSAVSINIYDEDNNSVEPTTNDDLLEDRTLTAVQHAMEPLSTPKETISTIGAKECTTHISTSMLQALPNESATASQQENGKY